MSNNYLDILSRFADEHNLIIGVSSAKDLNIKGAANAPFVSFSHEDRTSPRRHLENANSIIVVGVPDLVGPLIINDDKPRGYLSWGYLGEDYHLRVKGLLNLLADKLLKLGPFEYRIFCDTGPLIERELAVLAGLGHYGKNQAVISDKFGSYFNIGYLITDLKLPVHDGSSQDICGDCSICVNACPGHAIGYYGDFDYTRCISYLTQKKGELEQWEKELVRNGNHLFGCDICQRVCPKNEGKLKDTKLATPELDYVLSAPKSAYKQTAVWNMACLRRNANICLGDSR